MTETVAEPLPQRALPVDLAMVQRAAVRIKNTAIRTPVPRSDVLDMETGRSVWLKCETFQRTGSFKFRGAYNRLVTLDQATRACGVVAFSSGNHAQAVALAAKLLDIEATIVMPRDAPPVKLHATRGYGANVVTYDRLREDREAIARGIADDRGATVVPPFNDPEIIAGQGTMALELLTDVPNLDALVAPVGGGGLISGNAVAAKGMNSAIQIFGVETERADDARRSLDEDRIIHIPPRDTIADGIRTQALGELPFAFMRDLVTDVVTVSEEEVIAALRYAAFQLKLVLEPTGAVGLAAVLFGKLPPHVSRVGVILCGGNVEPALYARLLADS